MQENRALIYVAVILAMIFWSFSFVWIKVVYLAYGPLTTVLFRLVIATSLMLLFSKLTGKLQKPSRKDTRNFLLLAFFEPFLYFMGESFGLLYVSSTVGAVIVSTIPLFSPLAASRYHGEKISMRTFLGIIISFLGVSMVVFDTSFNLQASPLGILLEFLAVWAAIGYAVVLKNLAHKYNPSTIITYQSGLGALYFLPFWLGFEMQEFITTPFHGQAFWAIVKLAIFASCLAFILFTYSVKHLGVNNTNTFINIIPVFTAIFAWYILDEALPITKMAGIAVVISGLFISQINTRKLTKKFLGNAIRGSE